MDPLSDLIALLRPHAAISKPISGRGDWGVRYPPYRQPGFAVVLEGHCWLEIAEAEPVRLERGDFVLLPAAPAFAMVSRLGIACIAGTPSSTPVHHGEAGEPDFRMLGGAFAIETVNAPLLTALLPDLIHVRAADGATDRIHSIIDLILDECDGERSGRDMVLERLLEILLVETLRQHGSEGRLPAGLLAGMRDPALARSLRAIHAEVGAAWTVATLAAQAGMSRTAFAARFAEILGCPPMEYVARWRMALAKDALTRGTPSLDRLAETIGYESASAFSTAFRRRIGIAPGRFARANYSLGA